MKTILVWARKLARSRWYSRLEVERRAWTPDRVLLAGSAPLEVAERGKALEEWYRCFVQDLWMEYQDREVRLWWL